MKLIGSTIEEFKSVFVLCDQIPELEPGTRDEFYRCEAKLNRLFPVVNHQTRTRSVLPHLGSSCTLIGLHNQVRSSDDFSAGSSQLRFVSASSGDADNVRAVSFRVASTFGLHVLTWNQQVRSFIETRGNTARVSTQLSVTAPLPARGQWVVVSAFRSAEYSRPLRVGNSFLLKTMGGRMNHQKFMANPAHDHLRLRNSPAMIVT